MKIPFLKFSQSALIFAAVTYAVLPGVAEQTTTVTVEGAVRQSPEKTGSLLPQWPVGIYLDEVPSQAALCERGKTNDQGSYKITAENLANVENIWVLNEKLDDQASDHKEGKPAHVLVRLPRDRPQEYHQTASDLVLTPKDKALTVRDAAAYYIVAVIFDRATPVHLKHMTEAEAKKSALAAIKPVVNAQFHQEPDAPDSHYFWNNVIWMRIKSPGLGENTPQ